MLGHNDPLLQFSSLQAKKQRLDHLQFLVAVDHGIILKRLRDQISSDDFTQFILEHFPGDRLQDVALYFLLANNIKVLESSDTPWEDITIAVALEQIKTVEDSTSLYPVRSKLDFISSLQAYEVSFLFPADELDDRIVNSNSILIRLQHHIQSILRHRALTDLTTLTLN